MRVTRNLFALAAAAAAYLVVPAQANANTLTLNAVLIEHQYQQTTNRPCVIGENSCTYVTPVPPTTNAVISDSGGPIDVTSADFLVSTIRALFGGTGDTFMVGFDVNQTNVVQTISRFEMYVNDVLIDSYAPAIATPVPPTIGGGNGTGYADYLFTGFTSLAGFGANDIVTFRAVMPITNDGREQFFLIELAGPNPCTGIICEPVVTPEPGTLLMFGTGLALLAARLRRRKA